MDTTEEEYLGGVAYSAYHESIGWKSATGATYPDFYTAPETVRKSWIMTAQAVKDSIESYVNKCSYP